MRANRETLSEDQQKQRDEAQQRVVDVAIDLCEKEHPQFEAAYCTGPDDEELFDL